MMANGSPSPSAFNTASAVGDGMFRKSISTGGRVKKFRMVSGYLGQSGSYPSGVAFIMGQSYKVYTTISRL